MSINGHEVNVKEFKYFLSTMRGSVIDSIYSSTTKSINEKVFWKSTIDGKPAGELAKEKTMEEMIEYETLLTKAVELGIVEFEDTPFYCNNLEKMSSNNTMYGPQTKSREMIVNDFVNEVKKNIIVKLYDESKIDTKELNSYFDKNREKFKSRENIKIRRLFLKYIDDNGKVDSKLKCEKYDLAVKLLGIIKSGENFEELVSNYSEDANFQDSKGVQTVSQDGKINKFVEQNIVKASFDLKVNEVSDVIEMGMGFLIIKCEEKKPSEGPAFTKVKPIVVKCYIEDKYNDEFTKWMRNANVVINWDIYRKISLD